MHAYAHIPTVLGARRWGFLGLAFLLATALLVTACEDDENGAADDGADDEDVSAPEVVEREEISFVSPDGWVGSENTWTSPDGDVTLLFGVRDIEDGAEPAEVMLPEDAETLATEDADTPLGAGTMYTIELPDETDTGVYERHVIVSTEAHIYDWWLAAETQEQLDEFQGTLDEVLASVQRLDEDGNGADADEDGEDEDSE